MEQGVARFLGDDEAVVPAHASIGVSAGARQQQLGERFIFPQAIEILAEKVNLFTASAAGEPPEGLVRPMLHGTLPLSARWARAR